jgi:hypothetical protein
MIQSKLIDWKSKNERFKQVLDSIQNTVDLLLNQGEFLMSIIKIEELYPADVDNNITDLTEAELSVTGGTGHSGSRGGSNVFYSSRGNTSGLIAVGVLNGNNIGGILGFQNNVG